MLTLLYIKLLEIVDEKHLKWLDRLSRIEDKILTRFYKIKRIIVYIPVLWKLSDYDYSSALDIYAFQLKRLKISLINGHCVQNPKLIRRLSEYINRIERISSEHDEQALLDGYYEKYPLSFDDLLSNRVFPNQKERYKKLKQMDKKLKHLISEHWAFIDRFNRKYLSRCWD